MISIQGAKKSVAFNAGVTNGNTATGVIDRLGYDYVSIDVLMTTSNNTTNKPSVLKLSESDDAITYADVSGFVGGTDFTVPAAVTAATSNTLPVATLNVDCKARKRYLKVSVSPVTTQDVTIVANLTRAEQLPVTAATANTGVLVVG